MPEFVKRPASFVSKRSVHSVRVLYQDTDQARVVHHAAYLRFLEAARIEFFRDHGFDYDAFEKRTGLGMPVVEVRMRYVKAARFDDVLAVESWISEVSRASVWINARITRGEERIFDGSVRLCCVSHGEGQLQKIPEEFLRCCLEPGHDV